MEARNKKTKSKYMLVVLIGMVWILSGCTKDSNFQSDLGLVPIHVSNLELKAEPLTRAGGTTINTEGAVMKAFLTAQGGYTPTYNTTYTYTSGQWFSMNPIYVDKRIGKVVGVYDPNGLISFGTNSTITTNVLQAQAYAENKLWYYDNSSGTAVNNTNPKLPFSMKCAYSRLSFSISRNATYTSACKISQIKIGPSVGKFLTTAQVNVIDGTLIGTPVTDYNINTSSLPINTSGISVGTTDTSIDYLFPAQTLENGAGIKITLTIDGLNFSATVPADKFNQMERGVRYLVQLEITPALLKIIINGYIEITDIVTDNTTIENTPMEI